MEESLKQLRGSDDCITGKVSIGRLKNMWQVVKLVKQQIILDPIFQRLYIDLIGPFPRFKNGHI